MGNDLAIFEGHQIRRTYDEKTETWWFSVVDIIQVLTQQPDFQTARKYWNKLKERLTRESQITVSSSSPTSIFAVTIQVQNDVYRSRT